MQETKERIQRFIEAFEKVYGRKPKLDDTEGNFKLQVAQDMQMSVGGARYYLRLAVAHKEEEAYLNHGVTANTLRNTYRKNRNKPT